MLPKVQLGNTGKELSRFGLGGFHQLEITTDQVAEVVSAFLAAGGNYIETARGYGGGASEVKIGRALAGRANDVILASKTSAATADDARADLETSLKTLGRDRLEFYFLHGVSPEKLKQITAPGGAVEGLTRARDEGLIDGIGLSSHHPPVYLDAIDQIDLSLILVWCNYLDNLNFPIIPERIIPTARKRGVGVTADQAGGDGIRVVANTSDQHAVHSGGEIGIVFRKAGSVEMEPKFKVSADEPCLVLLRATGNDRMLLSVADPTQKLEQITVTLSGSFDGPGARCDSAKDMTAVVFDLTDGPRAGSTVSKELSQSK